MFVVGDAGDGGSNENSAVYGFGIGLLADGAGGVVNRFDRSGEKWSDLFKDGNSEHETSHKEGTAASFGDDFDKIGGSSVGLKKEK